MSPYSRFAKQLLLVLGLSLMMAANAAAAALYETSFEDPLLANNSVLVGQDGWVGAPILSPNAARISAGPNTGGIHTLRVNGIDLEHQDALNDLTGGYYDAIGSYRRPVNFQTGGSQNVRVAADVYLAGPKTPDGNNFFSAAIGTRTELTDGSTGGTGELAISSDGHVYGYCGCENVPTFKSSAPVTLNAWHNLAIDMDLGARTYSFLVDGIPLGTFDFLEPPDPEAPTVDYTTILTRGSLLAYAAPNAGGNLKNQYAAYYDNFSIGAIPEPATMLFLVVSAPLLILRRPRWR
jgi:hypothetical protein